MTITFDCGNCGKAFTVDREMAGKKGRCKSCGTIMRIPNQGPATILTEAVALAVDRDSRVARPASKPAPARNSSANRDDDWLMSQTQSIQPKADLYGLEEESLPPRAPMGWSGDVDRGSTRTKSRRWSSGSSGGSYGNSSAQSRGNAGLIVIRVIVGVISLAGSSLVFPGIRSAIVPGWASHSEVEGFYQRELALMEELIAVFQSVHDIHSAAAASSRANATIEKLYQFLLVNKDRVASQKDLDELSQKYKISEQAAGTRFANEAVRVRSIPGAIEAMGIMGALMKLDQLINSVKGTQTDPSAFVPKSARGPAPRFNPPPSQSPPPAIEPPSVIPPQSPMQPPSIDQSSGFNPSLFDTPQSLLDSSNNNNQFPQPRPPANRPAPRSQRGPRR